MRGRRVAGWSNVALASAVVMALTACGGGDSEESKEAQSEPMAATSSAEPSEAAKTPQTTVSSQPAKEREQEELAKLLEVTDVKVTETADGDRVTFTFAGPAPDHLDSYEKALHGAEGRPIKIEGSKFLRVAFIGVGPEAHFASPTPNERVLEVRYLMNFESELSVGIGIEAPDGAADPAYEITSKGNQVLIDIKD